MPEPGSDKVPSVLRRALTTWNPRPIPIPQPDPDVTRYGAVERAAEVLRYHLLQVEYALSPSGVLRELLKLCLRLVVLLCIPALLIVPALVVIAAGLADLAGEIVRLCVNLLKGLLAIAAILLIGGAVLAGLGSRRK